MYRIDESEFTYNKDSDEWQCNQGNTSVYKKYYKKTRAKISKFVGNIQHVFDYIVECDNKEYECQLKYEFNTCM